jgi:hypothetical protein
MARLFTDQSVYFYRGSFISPSEMSNLCGTVAGMVTPMGNITTEGERLQVSVVPYTCSICPFCCVVDVAQTSSEVPEGLMNYSVYQS